MSVVQSLYLTGSSSFHCTPSYCTWWSSKVKNERKEYCWLAVSWKKMVLYICINHITYRNGWVYSLPNIPDYRRVRWTQKKVCVLKCVRGRGLSHYRSFLRFDPILQNLNQEPNGFISIRDTRANDLHLIPGFQKPFKHPRQNVNFSDWTFRNHISCDRDHSTRDRFSLRLFAKPAQLLAQCQHSSLATCHLLWNWLDTNWNHSFCG